MQKIVIAIDGYSSCGKSTFARLIAARLGYIFIDTGAMYRAVTHYAMQQGLINTNGQIDTETLIQKLPEIQIDFRYNPARQASDVYLNGENLEEKIRSIEVSSHVSAVSQIPQVRNYLVHKQQALGHNKGVVMDGRDIGTVVFPNAELKLFMTADPLIRAQRRFQELAAKGQNVPLGEVLKNLHERDYADQNRTISPLRQAPDALVLDNSHMTIPEQMTWVFEKINTLQKSKTHANHP